MIYSFAPIADENSEILILGSIPGGESLRKRQYYGFDKNSFWKILFYLFGEDFRQDYKDKTEFLLRKRVALWDVIKSCERKGSLDSNIKNVTVNDFHSFFRCYTNIKHVFFNGRTAYNLFNRYIGFEFENLTFTYLGSTSPAHAVAFLQKINDWKKILRH